MKKNLTLLSLENIDLAVAAFLVTVIS